MTNEAQIDIQVDDSDVSALVSVLGDLKQSLDASVQAMNRMGGSAENLERDVEDLEQATERAERSINAMGAAAAGAAAALAAGFAAIEGGKLALEAFAETNAEAAARMEGVSTAAQTLLGNFGQMILGGDQFASTLDILTTMFERLNEVVMANSETMADLGLFVVRGLVQGFFFLIDAGLSVVEFVQQLDTNLLRLEVGFLNAKASVLEFADDALEAMGNFIAGGIEGFADLLDSIDDFQTAIIDNPLARTLFGIDENTDITGPVGVIANGMRSAAESIRTATTGRFADDISRAADRAEALNEIIEDTENPIRDLRDQFRGVRDEILGAFDDIDNWQPRDIEIGVSVTGGGGGGGGGGAAAEEDNALISLLGTTKAGLEGAEALYAEVITNLLQISADAREEFKLEDTVIINIPRAAATDPRVAEYESMLEQRRAAIAESERINTALSQSEEELNRRLAPIYAERAELESMLQTTEELRRRQRGEPPTPGRMNVRPILEEMGAPLDGTAFNILDVGGDTVYHAQWWDETTNSIRTAQLNLSEFDREIQTSISGLNQQAGQVRQTLRNQEDELRAQLEANQAITSAGFEAERALLEDFYNEVARTVVTSSRFRHEEEAAARQEAIDAARRDAQRLKKEMQTFTIDTSELTTGFGMRGDRDRRRRLQEIGATEFDTEAEAIRALTAALTDQERAWAKANGGVVNYMKTLSEMKAQTRAAFKADALDAFQNSFETLGSSIGTALGGGFDDALTGAERSKVILFELLGSTLQALGTTAIAQGGIYAFGDPTTAGLPNPVRAAGLIAAGTVAMTAGAAFSARAGAIQSSAGAAPGVTPATTPGGGGTAESTTNVFIENRFGNRFDAREIDRAAAESFASAASAGQA